MPLQDVPDLGTSPVSSHAIDDHWRDALAQARLACPISAPNPAVGCVIVGPSGQLLARGHTQAVGQPHAEAAALAQAAQAGLSIKGATVYVTLEPCSHFGRTPPCADALIAAQPARVMVALRDPNPLVSGRGLERLQAAGVAVEVLAPTHPVAIEARELNIGFLSRMERQRPWVRLKVAASLDGYTALPSGASQWITSDAARLDGHRWRSRSGAILTGIGTVLADDPQLTVRGFDVPRQPLRVVVDSRLTLPLHARLLQAGPPLRIYTAAPDRQRQAQLQALGAEVVDMPSQNGQVDLLSMVKDLASHEVNELHVEAGATLNGSLLQAGLVDEILLYLAPKLLAQGRGMWRMNAAMDLSQAQTWQWHSVTPIGPDLRLILRPDGSAVQPQKT